MLISSYGLILFIFSLVVSSEVAISQTLFRRPSAAQAYICQHLHTPERLLLLEKGEPYCDCMCELLSSTQIFENHHILAPFEAKRYEQTHLKSVMFLTIETEATRCKMTNYVLMLFSSQVL